MAEIIPVEDKLKIQAYCIKFDAHFKLSYSAYVVLNKGDAVGICLFETTERLCSIKEILFSEEIRDTSIPFLLLRAVVHFADGCGIKTIIVEAQSVSPSLTALSGFAKDESCGRRIYYHKGYIDR